MNFSDEDTSDEEDLFYYDEELDTLKALDSLKRYVNNTEKSLSKKGKRHNEKEILRMIDAIGANEDIRQKIKDDNKTFGK